MFALDKLPLDTSVRLAAGRYWSAERGTFVSLLGCVRWRRGVSSEDRAVLLVVGGLVEIVFTVAVVVGGVSGWLRSR